jgi:hypothetical protein
MKNKNKYPTEYYDYEDIPLKIYYDSKEEMWVCVNWGNIPWPISKAMALARRVTKSQHDNVVEAYRDYFWQHKITDDQLNCAISKNFGTKFFQKGKEIE